MYRVMALANQTKHAFLISFSGIDGAGKSTQIQALSAHLGEKGLRVDSVAFWDSVATLTRFRESAGYAIFNGDRGVGSPVAPIERRDKNVRSPLMTLARLCLYSFDAVSLRRIVRKASCSGADVVLFDRYLYDELANLPLQYRFIRIWCRLLLAFVPRPHVALLLDANPEQARARKPEYPLDFLLLNRQAYLALAQLEPCIKVIAPMQVDAVQRDILEVTLTRLSIPTSPTATPDSRNDKARAAVDSAHPRPAS